MNILIVDDHPLIRYGIQSTLLLENNIDTVTQASNILEAINVLSNSILDLAIVDIYLGKENGYDLIEKCKKNSINVKFMILTSSIKKDDFIRAQRLDVDGYVLKDAFMEDIIYAINIIMRGKRYYDPEILQYISSSPSYNTLTSREYDVLIELEKGLSNADIAKNLFISEHTVKKHISSILSKLELNNRTEIALYAANYASFSLN